MMKADPTLVANYGEALFKAALKSGSLDLIAQQAEALISLDDGGRQKASAFFEAPNIPCDVKEGILVRTFASRINTLLLNFQLLALRRGRVEVYTPALRDFIARYRKHLGITRATITTAAELNPEDKARLEKSLADFTSLRLVLRYRVDPQVIGGIRFQCGDLLVDSTLSRKLERLNHDLLQAKVY